MSPFLKWAGGKRQLLSELRVRVRQDFGLDTLCDGWPKALRHYCEPFVGGGALFFALRASGWMGAATLGDSNARLGRTYFGVRGDVESVIKKLSGMRYDKSDYLDERKRSPENMASHADVAAWLIYLNKCGFNGLYRVNAKDRFNVPFGRYTNPTICDADNLRVCSVALKNTKILIGDFESTTQSLDKGDLVYFDPPYVPVNKTSNFTGYTRDGFTLDDQIRLRDCAAALKKRGVHVLLSNADVPKVREIYKKFDCRPVDAKRSINSKVNGRGFVRELIIT